MRKEWQISINIEASLAIDFRGHTDEVVQTPLPPPKKKKKNKKKKN